MGPSSWLPALHEIHLVKALIQPASVDQGPAGTSLQIGCKLLFQNGKRTVGRVPIGADRDLTLNKFTSIKSIVYRAPGWGPDWVLVHTLGKARLRLS
jgi:hypothetical protein